MTDNEKQKIKAMYDHYNYKCFVSGKPAKMRAHIIGDTKPNIKRYGLEIICNSLNWLPAADLHCNSLIDISNDPIKRELVAMLIMQGERELIEDEVRLNIERKEAKVDRG